LTNLETLDFGDCRTLSKLPACVGGLKMLKTLNMQFTEVRDLPIGFGLLMSLISLRFPVLYSVGEVFQGLQSLSFLHVWGGSADMGSLGALIALKELNLGWHKTITALPKSLGNLKLLVRVEISLYKELLIVEALPEGSEYLSIKDCINLVEIPSLASMRSLVCLNLSECKQLRRVCRLEFLTTLKEIYTIVCTSIEGCRIGGVANSTLEECDMRGSRVSVAYNNSQQVVGGKKFIIPTWC
jgi:Leucine-rich repeat (LRR) protein